MLTKLILAFGENQLSILFDGLMFGDEPTKAVLLEFLQLIIVIYSSLGSFSFKKIELIL